MRSDHRRPDELRPISLKKDVLLNPEGSALIEWGNTKVMATACVSYGVPSFVKENGGGWLTAEYGMLPGSTKTRKGRGADGRSTEIQRLIGRVLRSVTDLNAFDGYTVNIDCDVIQADGGTRAASITAASVALYCAFEKMKAEKLVKKNPLTALLAAVSCGIVNGMCVLDLCYEEDSRAIADMNIVISEKGGYAEIQGTGEGRPFSRSELTTLLDYANEAAKMIVQLQKETLGLA